jgi:hypothetical protein
MVRMDSPIRFRGALLELLRDIYNSIAGLGRGGLSQPPFQA